MKNVNIYGAGISGLTAAINLAKKGFGVTIFEKESKIGGIHHKQPSIHMTPIDLQKIKEYIGIDVGCCFSELESFIGYIYSKKVTFDNKHLYVVERGSKDTSLDTYLYKIALKEGVKIEFSSPLTADNFNDISDNSIIATGSYPDIYKIVKIFHGGTKRFDSTIKITKNNFCLTYFDSNTKGYCYISSKNGLCSGHIAFALTDSDDVDYFKNKIEETEGIKFLKFSKSYDSLPRRTKLYKHYNKKTLIFAGTISGFVDPFFGFGINAALVSGKIASIAVESKKLAKKEFNKFTRELDRMYTISKFYYYIPFKNLFVPRLFKTKNKGIPIIGTSMKNIPGFTHEDCFKILNVSD